MKARKSSASRCASRNRRGVMFPHPADPHRVTARRADSTRPTGARLCDRRPAQISREQAQRRIVVECNVTDRDIGGFVKEAQAKIDAAVNRLPPGCFITWAASSRTSNAP